MPTHRDQLSLFDAQSVNVAVEVKRQIRLALGESRFSRDEICDQVNRLAAIEGIRRSLTKATLDSWLKDDPGRMPSLQDLVLLCSVLKTLAPINALAKALGGRVINEEENRLLAWAKAEVQRRKAARRAKLALEAIEV